MNEEREPNVPPLTRSERPDEFARMRGEIQHPGDRVLAIPPPEPPAPIGIAPPDPLNVVSTFDTRPISAYDFAEEGAVVMATGEVATAYNVTTVVPAGFTAVLRKVRFEFTPNAVVNLTSAGARRMLLNLLRNGGVIANNDLALRGSLDVFEWVTHQVYGQGEILGARLRGSWDTPAGDLLVSVHLYGNLIRTKNRPSEFEIASAPVITQTLADRKSEVQR